MGRPLLGAKLFRTDGVGDIPSSARMSFEQGRLEGSRPNKPWHSSSSSAGTPATSSDGRGAGLRILSAMMRTEEPVKGLRPVNASKRMTPNAYQSLAVSTGPDVACSGAMY